MPWLVKHRGLTDSDYVAKLAVLPCVHPGKATVSVVENIFGVVPSFFGDPELPKSNGNERSRRIPMDG